MLRCSAQELRSTFGTFTIQCSGWQLPQRRSPFPVPRQNVQTALGGLQGTHLLPQALSSFLNLKAYGLYLAST